MRVDELHDQLTAASWRAADPGPKFTKAWRIAAMLNAGGPCNEIAAVVESPVVYVRDVRSDIRHGLLPEPRRMAGERAKIKSANGSRDSLWTDARVAALRRMCAEGLSAAEIERAFGLLFTRNAVLGKMHRTGIKKNPRADAVKRVDKKRRERTRVADRLLVQPRLPRVPLPPPTGEVGRIPFAETNHTHCLWIAGEPAWNALVCGLPRVPGLSWCEYHARRAHNQPQPRCQEPAPQEQEAVA